MTDRESAAGSSRRRRLRLLGVGVWFAVIVGYQGWALRQGITPKESVLRIVDAMRTSAWGPLLFIGAELVRPLLLLSAAMLTIGAAFLYGVVLALVLVVIATNTSAMVAYAIGRLIEPHRRPAPHDETRLGRHMHRLSGHAFETVVTLRLLFVPYDLVSYVCGYSRVRPLTFLAATALGSLPGTITFVLLGASLERLTDASATIDWRLAGASAVLLGVTLATAHLLHRRNRGSRSG